MDDLVERIRLIRSKRDLIKQELEALKQEESQLVQKLAESAAQSRPSEATATGEQPLNSSQSTT